MWRESAKHMYTSSQDSGVPCSLIWLKIYVWISRCIDFQSKTNSIFLRYCRVVVAASPGLCLRKSTKTSIVSLSKSMTLPGNVWPEIGHLSLIPGLISMELENCEGWKQFENQRLVMTNLKSFSTDTIANGSFLDFCSMRSLHLCFFLTEWHF